MSEERNLILAVNAGSSSLKISVFRPNGDSKPAGDLATAEPVSLLLTASIENLSAPPARFSFKSASREVDAPPVKNAEAADVHDHASAFEHFLHHLQDATRFDRTHVAHVCHRVVHGGRYPGPVLISSESMHHIERLSDLAPLHNGNALIVIRACLKILPDADSIAFFDSSFHSSMPDYVAKYAINPDVAEPKGLRKYGFHGLSYAYILRAVAAHLKKPVRETTLIVLHLGSGASVCAIRVGRSYDTSMGLTPLDGLPGATRSGGVDPSLIFHYTNDASKISHEAAGEVRVTDAEEILNKNAGWKSLAGTTDFAEIAAYSADPVAHPRHALAFNIFVDRILTFVGSYFLKLGGAAKLDALVFAGGIGERSARLRGAVVERCRCIGLEVDESRNAAVEGEEGVVVEIGAGLEGVKTLVCRTDEQLEMARECVLQENIAR